MITEQVLNRLKNVKSCGDGWSAECPAHLDTHNSLSINIGVNGQVLVHCFAGCTAQEIVSAMGLGMRDLFPSRRRSR